MRTISTPITNQTVAEQGAWAEVYDIYLKSAIVTPWGTISTLRLTDAPAGAQFFTPKISPEPVGNFGVAQAYQFWPLKRQTAQSDAKFTAGTMTITASNVTTEWAQMLADVDWYDVAVVIRKISLQLAGATADDCAVVWSGATDAVQANEQTISLQCSNDLANLQTTAPRENMHANCRFAWSDDQCTALRFLPANYKSKTVGAGSTKTNIICAGLTEDTGTSGTYGTDLIDALAGAAITASSNGTGYTGQNVLVATSVPGNFNLTAHTFETNDPVTFASPRDGTGAGVAWPTGISAGVTYYVRPASVDSFRIVTSPTADDGSYISLTGLPASGLQINVSTLGTFNCDDVRASQNGFWKFGTSADWGTKTNGYWVIPDAQAGMTNEALKPYIQFDMGSARQLKLWRISTVTSVQPEKLVRMVQFFSSPDAATWVFEGYYEFPPTGGVLRDILIPLATSNRYWRICIRSRWSQTVFYSLLNKVSAYVDSRHWWKGGIMKFDAATTTVALRGIARHVLESYAGSCVVTSLPAAPVAGDTFTIERGCGRTFNDCATRRNTENFGGFTTLAYQEVVR